MSKDAGTRLLPTLVILNYNLPTVGVGFMFFIVTLYLMKFSTDELLIPPVVMGIIFGLSRIWDAVTDPMAGYFSDRTSHSSGRRRPWIFMSALPVCASFYMMWNPPLFLEGNLLIAWMAVAVLLFYTAMTIFVVPHASLGAELSHNYHERTKVFGFRHALWNTGSLLALVAMYFLITGENVRQTAHNISILAGLVTVVLIWWMVVMIRERTEYQGRGELNPMVAFRDVVKNPHARLLLIVFFVENLGAATIGIMTPYVAEYVVGRPEKTVFYIFCYLVPSIASVPLWLPLSRRFGKKPMWMFSMLVTGFGFGGMFFLKEGSDTMISVLAFICGLGAGSGAVVAPSIQSDIIDYDEYLSGKRKEGAYFAAWNFVFKTSTGITLMLTGFLLGASGFVPNTEQSEITKLAMRSLYALFPLVCYLSATWVFRNFSLDEEEHRRIRAHLDSPKL